MSMNGITFERLLPERVTQADFNRLVLLEAECGLPDPYPPAVITEILERFDTFVCRAGNEIIGFIMVNEQGRYFGSSVYIININVALPHRGQGVAKRLILEACRYYLPRRPERLMSLDVSKTSKARALYEKNGFRPSFLPSRNGITDIVMAAPMKALEKNLSALL